LAEKYPNSFIVANEFDRNRTSQLMINIERMGADNV
jgi:16S rRNA C967 or C1407 C5-methylase (RsmB/RsmF family)